MPVPAGDRDPSPVIAPCGDPTPLVPVFVPPPAPALDVPPPRRLPTALAIGNPEVSLSCPDGMSPTSPDTVQPAVVTAGAHTVSLFLDTVLVDGSFKISRAELYRIAPLMPSLQEFADVRLRDDDVDLEEVTTEVLTRLMVTPVVAASIAVEMLAMQSTVSAMAFTEATMSLSCAYWNVAMWLVCDELTGWHAHYGAPAPGAHPEPFVPVPAGVASSVVSQEDADERAGRGYAGELPCVYPNEIQTASCLDLDTEYYGVSVPVDTDTPVALESLDGRVFDTADTLASGLPGRELIYRVTVLQGTYFAADTAAANALAMTAAVSGLDCFIPSRALVTSCTDAVDGVAVYNPAVLVRKTAAVYSDENVLDELATGSPARPRNDAGTIGYHPDNVGVLGGQLDTRVAVRVTLPAGLFVDSTSQAIADAMATTHAQSLIDCVWKSPEHRCQCLADGDAEVDSSPYVSRLVGLTTEYGVNLHPTVPMGELVEAVDGKWVSNVHVRPISNAVGITHTIEAGTYVSVDIPTVDPVGAPGGPLWPELATICAGSLTCEFKACAVVFCEPRPDNRRAMVNGEDNWMSWNFNSSRAYALPEYLSTLNTVMALEFTSPDLCANVGWMADCAMDEDNRDYMVLTGDEVVMHELGDKLTGGWYTKAQEANPLGTPPVFVNGGVLSATSEWASNCGVGAGSATIPPVASTQGFFSGACGCYIETNPGDLWSVVMGGKNDAMSRMDCAHTSWERTISRCPTPSHVAGKTNVHYADRPISDSTELANIITEAAIIAELDCQDATGGQIGSAGESVQMGNFTAQNVGPDECEPVGKKDIELKVETAGGGVETLTPASAMLNDLGSNEVRHYTIIAKCAPSPGGDNTLQFFLTMRSSTAEGEINEVWAATAGGPRVTKAPASVAALQAAAGIANSWYIGSIVRRSDAATGNKPVIRILQFHVGPLIVTKTCCDDSSSSDSSSSDSSDSESSDSDSSDSSDSDSSGGSSDDSSPSVDSGESSIGSDKSTAIIPMASSPTGYRALFTMESNRVLFEFPMDDVQIEGRETVVVINPDWLSACVPGSLRVYGAPSGNRPFPVSAVVEGGCVRLKGWPTSFLRPTFVDFKLTGVRKGHALKDMPTRTRQQFLDNETFINSAYGPK